MADGYGDQCVKHKHQHQSLSDDDRDRKKMKLEVPITGSGYQSLSDDDRDAKLSVEPIIEYLSESDEDDDRDAKKMKSDMSVIGSKYKSKMRELGPDDLKRICELEEKLDRELLVYAEFAPLDVSNAKRIVFDLSEIRRLGIDVDSFSFFVSECHDRRTLKIYDHPGDPRTGGFSHWDGDSISVEDSKIGEHALDYYHTHFNPDSRLTLVKVDQISFTPDCGGVYYLTFTAHDEITNDSGSYQAQLMAYEYDKFILGLLRVRDAEEDHVLAIAEIKEGLSAADLVDSDDEDEN